MRWNTTRAARLSLAFALIGAVTPRAAAAARRVE